MKIEKPKFERLNNLNRNVFQITSYNDFHQNIVKKTIIKTK